MPHKTITIESPTYGTYTATLVGTISYKQATKNGMSEDDIWNWSQKYLPKRFFVTCLIKQPDSETKENATGTKQIFVPLRSNNPNLPIAIDDKKVETWRKNSTKLLVN